MRVQDEGETHHGPDPVAHGAPFTGSFNPSLLAALLKAFGALALGMSFLLFAAARDPVRNVAIIDAFAGMLVLLALVDVYAVLALGLTNDFPAYLVWGRIALRLIVAAALVALRPRGQALRLG